MKDNVEGKGVSAVITPTARVPCSALRKSEHSRLMHPWLFKLCAAAVKGMKLLPSHEEMNGAFISCLWPKHLDGFRPSRLFLIAGKIDCSGTLIKPFYLQRKYKILFPWTEEESDNRRHFLCTQFQSFQPALYPEALHQLFVLKVVLVEFIWFCLLLREGCSCQTIGAHSCSKHCPPPCIFKALHFSWEKPWIH